MGILKEVVEEKESELEAGGEEEEEEEVEEEVEEGEEEMEMQMEEKNKNKEKEKVKEEEIKVERQPDTEEEKHFRAELQGEDLDTLYSQLPSYNLLCRNFGGRNPLEKMSFYEITPPMRTYIILYLCEYLADYNDKIMKEMEETEAVDQRAHYLGCDSLERDYWFLEQYYSDCRIFRTTTHGEDKKTISKTNGKSKKKSKNNMQMEEKEEVVEIEIEEGEEDPDPT